jgi:hypothetical protein
MNTSRSRASSRFGERKRSEKRLMRQFARVLPTLKLADIALLRKSWKNFERSMEFRRHDFCRQPDESGPPGSRRVLCFYREAVAARCGGLGRCISAACTGCFEHRPSLLRTGAGKLRSRRGDMAKNLSHPAGKKLSCTLYNSRAKRLYHSHSWSGAGFHSA